MASKKVVLEGIANWAKVFEGNRDLEGYKGAFKETNGRTSINLLLDKDNLDLLQKSGTMKRPKPSADGLFEVKVDRKWETGRDWDSGAPQVFRADGNPWDVNVDGYIGNGSRVKVMVIVTEFPDKGVTSTRLEMIKVLDLVPYEGVADQFTKDESNSTPAAKKEDAVKVTSTIPDKDIDDEIPFDQG